jgi:hypothetical protein
MRSPRLAPVGTKASAGRYLVYVEGPRDRDVLAAWARRLSPPLVRAFSGACVILGGRQPARAAAHVAERRERDGGAAGLCVLDGDLPDAPAPEACEGLEYFTWRRRHIESYLLVPAAIERAARSRDTRLRRLLEDELPRPAMEREWVSFDAKRFLGPKGPLAHLLGRPFSAGGIARAMLAGEIHPEVRALCARIAAGLGVQEPEVTVQLRAGTRSASEEV